MQSGWCCRMMRRSTATSRRRRGGLARLRTGTWQRSRTGSSRCFGRVGPPRLTWSRCSSPILVGCSSHRGEGGPARRTRADRRRRRPVPDAGPGRGADRRRRGRPVRVRPERVPRRVGHADASVDHGPRGVRHHRGGRSGGAHDEDRRDRRHRTEHRLRQVRALQSGTDVSVHVSPVGGHEPTRRRSPNRSSSRRSTRGGSRRGRPRTSSASSR